MRKISVGQLLKTAGAYGLLSAVTVDSALLLTARLGLADVPGSWYINGPLCCWVVGGLPASIALSERLLTVARGHQHTKITSYEDSPGVKLRGIPIFSGRQKSMTFSHTAETIFKTGESAPEHRPAAWDVPIADNLITVREGELLQFLRLASKRHKYQFSRRYWCERRRPPIPRQNYEAYMSLLTGAGLVDGRHPQGGASGRLALHPRAAVFYLKNESPYRLN